MRRRDFIGLLGGAAAAWPIASGAQQSAVPVIGYLSGRSPDYSSQGISAFLKGLNEAGYVHGRNVSIEFRWAEGRADRLSALVADLVHRRVSVIAAASTPAALAAKAATTTIPIVFEMADDPVRLGLVTSLNRPDGNITGVATLNIEVAPKRLQLLHEVVPSAKVVALLVNPADATVAEFQTREVRSAAHILGLELHVLNARTETDFDAVFANITQMQAGGLVIAGDPLFASPSKQLGELTVRHAVPAIYGRHDFTAAGGLLSYGPDQADANRRTGVYVGRVLKGEKPADLPVQQATKVELYINLKTAKALGLTIPNTLVGRADEVFE
jgi:putative tryptophan/tyrosine transport system substrate-binding protein